MVIMRVTRRLIEMSDLYKLNRYGHGSGVGDGDGAVYG